MKEKNENRLIEYAFGELDAHEAEILRQELAADDEAAKFVLEFESLRQDLRTLDAEVPEHQLSTERLRHAILNDGLHKTRKRGSWISWLWMPATAGAMAFSLMAIMNRPVEPQLAINSAGMSQSAKIEDLALNEPNLLEKMALNGPSDFTTKGIEAEGSAVSKPEEKRANRVRRKSNRAKQSIDNVINSALASNMASTARTITTANTGASLTAPGASESNQMDAMPQPSAEPIIMISPENDSRTGARKATEKRSNDVVSISG